MTLSTPLRANVTRRAPETLGVALCAAGCLSASSYPVWGQVNLQLGNGYDSYSELNTETIARRERNRDYYIKKQRGATTVNDQPRDFAAPIGLRLGQSFVFPSLTATTTFDDNIFRSDRNKESDLKTVIAPSVTVRSNMPRHFYDLSLSGRIVTFLENSDQNHNDYNARLRGALHIDHAHTLSASLITGLGHEERGGVTAPFNAAEPVPVFHHRLSAGITRDVGRLYGTLSARAERWDYQDVKAQNGTTLDQDGRDQDVVGGRLQVGYRISPGFEVLTSASANRFQNEDTGLDDVDGYGYDLRAGIGFEASPLLRFEFMGGYGQRDFDLSSKDSISTAVFAGRVEWLPTRRITVRGNAARYISDTLGANSSPFVNTQIGAAVDYEIYHNVIGHAGISYTNSDFKNDNREDNTLTAGIGVDYLYSKNVHFTAGYQYVQRDSTDINFDSTNNRFTVGAKIQF